jgi:hypothetical protein
MKRIQSKIYSPMAKLACLFLLLLSMSSVVAQGHRVPSASLGSHIPIVAVWSENDGLMSQGARYLRFAIWDDGRVLFARDTRHLSTLLVQGKLPAERIAELERQLSESAVFRLKRTAYIPFDSLHYCMTVNVGKNHQALGWDEIPDPERTVVDAQKPIAKLFKECCVKINHLAASVRPRRTTLVRCQVEQVPQSWYPR